MNCSRSKYGSISSLSVSAGRFIVAAIASNVVLRVQIVDGAGHLDHRGDDFVWMAADIGQTVGECATEQILHGEVLPIFDLAVTVDARNARMVEIGHRPRFAAETLDVAQPDPIVADHLEGIGDAGFFDDRFVNLAHAFVAEFHDDAVTRQLRQGMRLRRRQEWPVRVAAPWSFCDKKESATGA